MVRKRIQMYTLTTEQQDRLVEIINEEFGPQLGFDEFANKLLGLFEDIPGFETIKKSCLNVLITKLWRIYRA